jgi:hypothetical protein
VFKLEAVAYQITEKVFSRGLRNPRFLSKLWVLQRCRLGIQALALERSNVVDFHIAFSNRINSHKNTQEMQMKTSIAQGRRSTRYLVDNIRYSKTKLVQTKTLGVVFLTTFSLILVFLQNRSDAQISTYCGHTPSREGFIYIKFVKHYNVRLEGLGYVHYHKYDIFRVTNLGVLYEKSTTRRCTD